MPRTSRVAAAAILLIAAAHLAVAAPFGRFGFARRLDLPGFAVSATGVVAKAPGADEFRFPVPAPRWHAAETSDTEQTVILGEAPGCPRKATASLFGTGVSLYYEGAVEFDIATRARPFITWPEGSAADGVPSPQVAWILVSFDLAQPPALLVLPPGTTGSFSLSGAPGAWRLRLEGPLKGWLRFAYPFGVRAMSTSTAADLGAMAQAFAGQASFFTAPAPKLLSLDLVADRDGVTASWTFSGQFVVPPAAVLAPLGGYGLKVRTAFERTGLATEAGPILKSVGDVLRIRFPCRSAGPGRAATMGAAPAAKLEPASDAPGSIASLALAGMLGDRPAGFAEAAETTLDAYEFRTAERIEPWSGQSVPYDASGAGLDSAAAIGLLNAVAALDRPGPVANPFLDSVNWRVDWMSWLPVGADDDVVRRAAALAAVADAMSDLPERRLDAALLEAGLAAERGLALYSRRAPGEAAGSAKFLEPLFRLRAALFGASIPGSPKDAGCDCVLGEARVTGRVRAVARPAGAGVFLDVAPSGETVRFGLILPPGTRVQAGDNVAELVASVGQGGLRQLAVTPTDPARGFTLRIDPAPDRAPRPPNLDAYAEPRL